jgi:hypothetical protein
LIALIEFITFQTVGAIRESSAVGKVDLGCDAAKAYAREIFYGKNEHNKIKRRALDDDVTYESTPQYPLGSKCPVICLKFSTSKISVGTG